MTVFYRTIPRCRKSRKVFLQQEASGFEGMTKSDLTETEEDSLLQIVFDASRPALLVQTWRAEVTGSWQALLGSHEKRLDVAVRSVGKLLVGRDADVGTCTAFLVGDRLALTASFCTRDFADGVGMRTTMRSGNRAAIDFSDALGLAAGTATAPVAAVKFIHPFFYLALLELECLPEGIAPMDLAAQMPSQLSGRGVVVLSFAAPSSGAAEVASVDPQMALYSAENVGLPLGVVNPIQSPVYLWRDLMKRASTAGVLRALVEKHAAGLSTRVLRRNCAGIYECSSIDEG
jgi:hypothetical protein